jgi:hypothetical protein
MASVIATWGTTEAERAMTFPCDARCAAAGESLFRAVTVRAPPPVVFRWLCQLRVAPYSYDWLDNGGRRSPRELTPGAERLERGQRVMGIFELEEFARDAHLTLLLRGAGRLFGPLAVTYLVLPREDGGSRLVVKLREVVRARGLAARLRWRLLAAGDLVMMRKQLLTLKALAEATARPAPSREGERTG